MTGELRTFAVPAGQLRSYLEELRPVEIRLAHAAAVASPGKATEVPRFCRQWAGIWRAWGPSRQRLAASLLLASPRVRGALASTAMTSVQRSGVVRNYRELGLPSGWAVAALAATLDSGPERRWWGEMALQVEGPRVVDVVSLPPYLDIRPLGVRGFDSFLDAARMWRGLSAGESTEPWPDSSYVRTVLDACVLRGFRRSLARSAAHRTDSQPVALPATFAIRGEHEHSTPAGLMAMQLEWLSVLLLRGQEADPNSLEVIKNGGRSSGDRDLRAWAERLTAERDTEDEDSRS